MTKKILKVKQKHKMKSKNTNNRWNWSEKDAVKNRKVLWEENEKKWYSTIHAKLNKIHRFTRQGIATLSYKKPDDIHKIST